MVEIITSAIAAVSAIICAVISVSVQRAEKDAKERDARTEKRAQQRVKEGRLQLAMISANTKLTVGVAMALKHGHCNGEVQEGLEAVEKANKEYETFLEEIALEHLTKDI